MKAVATLQHSYSSQHFDNEIDGILMHTIHQLYNGIQKHLEQKLIADGSLSFSQFLVLIGFSCNNDASISQAKLAENLTLTEATISRHIKVLVDNDILIKERSLSSKKTYELKLTKKGSRVFLDAKKIILRELNVIFKPISEDQKLKCIKSLSPSLTLLEKK